MWLAAFLATVLVWIFIVLVRFGIPHEISLGFWIPGYLPGYESSPKPPVLIIDDISWTLALAVSSLGLSTVLTAVSRLDSEGWRSWILDLALTALGILAVMAGNLIFIILIWTVMDLVTFLAWINQVENSENRRQVFLHLATRFTGTVLVILVMISPVLNEHSFSVGMLPQEGNPFILVAAFLRLAVIPFKIPLDAERRIPLGDASMLWLTSMAASLVLIVRVGGEGVPQGWFLPLSIIFIISSWYSVIQWMAAKHDGDGRSYWVATLISLAILTAVIKNPDASLVLGAAGLFCGGVLFLSSVHGRSLLIFNILAVFSMSMLPFSTTWLTASIFSTYREQFPPFLAVMAIIATMLAYALLLFGYIRHAIKTSGDGESPERWIWLLYIPGLAILMLTIYALGWIHLPNIRSLSLLEWTAGFMVSGITLGFLTLSWKVPLRSRIFSFSSTQQGLTRFLSPQSFFTLVRIVYASLKNLFVIFNLIFEGEGGLLWSYLFLIILISLVFQYGLIH